MNCERASVFLIDEKRNELWTKKVKGHDTTIRVPMDPMDVGFVGHVVKTKAMLNVLDAY